MTKRSQSLAPVPSDLLFYSAPDGTVKVQVLFRDWTAWLSQKTLAELFGVKVPAINKHLKNIYESDELERAATVSKMEIVQSEGDREVTREVELYNLDAIIAVGYRVLDASRPIWTGLPAGNGSPRAARCVCLGLTPTGIKSQGAAHDRVL